MVCHLHTLKQTKSKLCVSNAFLEIPFHCTFTNYVWMCPSCSVWQLAKRPAKQTSTVPCHIRAHSDVYYMLYLYNLLYFLAYVWRIQNMFQKLFFVGYMYTCIHVIYNEYISQKCWNTLLFYVNQFILNILIHYKWLPYVDHAFKIFHNYV